MKSGPGKLIRRGVRELAAYQAPAPTDLVKLSTHENPYRWPEPLVRSWLHRLSDVAVNRYPDAESAALKCRLRDYLGIDGQLPLMLGNGSDELIQLIVMAVAIPGAKVLAPEPSFVMYRHSSIVLGVEYVAVPLEQDSFDLSRDAMLDAIDTHRPAVVFLSHPNNPTGNLFDRSIIDEVIRVTEGLVVVDEAYAPFAQDTYLRELDAHDNVLVMRTLSKVGLAGLRLGMLMGPSPWMTELEKLRLPYNINVLSQVSACFALEHREVFDAQCERICADREALFSALSAMDDVHAYPSAANFVMFRVPDGSADQVFERLCDRGVLIKNLNGSSPALADCLRVSVGTAEENRIFLDALARSL